MYKIPIRDKEYGVGKRMGNDLYFHISYAEEILGKRKFKNAIKIAKNHGWFELNDIRDTCTIIKYNKKLQKISFIYCDEFDDIHEPGITYVVNVDLNKETIRKISYNKDFPIYHHKWLMVKDNYKGFNIEESKKRSEKISFLINSHIFDIDVKKIGSYNYWYQRLQMPVILHLMRNDHKYTVKEK